MKVACGMFILKAFAVNCHVPWSEGEKIEVFRHDSKKAPTETLNRFDFHLQIAPTTPQTPTRGEKGTRTNPCTSPAPVAASAYSPALQGWQVPATMTLKPGVQPHWAPTALAAVHLHRFWPSQEAWFRWQVAVPQLALQSSHMPRVTLISGGAA